MPAKAPKGTKALKETKAAKGTKAPKAAKAPKEKGGKAEPAASPGDCQATRKWAPFGDNTDSAEGSIPLDRRGRRGASTAWKTDVP